MMNKYRNFPMFEAGEGAGSAESMDFVKVSTARETIGAETTTCINTLNEGTEIVSSAFGTNGTAMRGGSSNFINSKWTELSDNFAAFKTYIDGILNSIQATTKSNEALETKVHELFSQLSDIEAASGGSTGVGHSVPAGSTTTDIYS